MKKTSLIAVMMGVLGATGVAVHGVAQAQPTCMDPTVTTVNLAANASRMVPQDKLMAVLMVEQRAATAAEAQALVNKRMATAKTVYDKATELKVSTGGYRVYRDYVQEDDMAVSGGKNKAKEFWVATQHLNIEGKNSKVLLDLVNSLQTQDFAVQSMQYFLSDEVQKALQDELTTEALANVQHRAEAIAKQLKKNSIHLARVDTSMVDEPFKPYMARGMMMAKAESDMATPPVVEAGESQVSVQVNVEVQLKN